MAQTEQSIGHTPGPWRIRENARHSPDECDLSICGDIWVLAYIKGPQYSHQEANARLIAAAPELLEALEWAVNDMHGVTKYTDPEQWNNCMALAEAAIAKATGASS